MANKQGGLHINREAISELASVYSLSHKALDGSLEKIKQQVSFLTDENTLEGADAEAAVKAVEQFESLAADLVRKIGVADQVASKLSAGYGSVQSTHNRNLQESKEALAATLMKMKATK